MIKKRYIPTALAMAVGLYGCGGASDNSPEFEDVGTAAYTVAPIFNVAQSQMPTPNDILFALEEAEDGTMYAGDDTTNPVVVGLDHMDGTSTLAHIDIKFDGSLDPDQTLDANPFTAVGPSVIPNPDQNVFLIPLRYPGGDPLLNEGEVPTLAGAFDYQVLATLALAGDLNAGAALAALPGNPEARAEIITLDSVANNTIRITPLTPLQPRTKYLVVITKDVEDENGNAIEESAQYELLSATGAVTGDMGDVQAAVWGWEALANGYFAFQDAVFASVDGIDSNVNRGIALSYTFTTGDPEAVLEAIAAPSEYFEDVFVTAAKQDAIAKLNAGTYNFTGDNSAFDLGDADEAVDAAINTTINSYLTDSTPVWSYYNADLAAAIGAAVYTSFADVASDSSLSYLVQLAAADAAEAVTGATLASSAVGVAAALTSTAVAGNPGVSSILPMPKSRTTNFYRLDCMGSVATGCADPVGGLSGPAFIAQGEITLPYYHETPANAADPTNIVAGYWRADEDLYNDISNIIVAGGGDALPALPSDKLTYRFPFPVKNADVTVPIMAVYPNEALGAVTKPADGWPVIIYMHGITANRMLTLPVADALANACVDPTDLTGNTATAASCFATIAIDQALHGIPPEGSFGLTSVDDPDVAPDAGGTQIGDNTPSADLAERHFNFYMSDDGVPAAMDYSADEGSSGTLFSNLSSFPTGRDNLRQSTVDLLNVLASLKDMDIDDDGNPDFDTDRVYFIGKSLGGVDGIPFLATNNKSDVQAAQAAVNATVAALLGGNTTLANADSTVAVPIDAAAIYNSGGFVTQLLLNSPSPRFGAPALYQGLAASSEGVLVQGSSSLETFMNVLQASLDSGDAMNFVSSIADEANTGLLLTEIIGGATVSVKPEDDPEGADVNEVAPSDQTIPNDADADVWPDTGVGPYSTVLDNGFVINSFATPLAGTEPLIDLVGAEKTADIVPDGNPVMGITRFTSGSHNTPVSAGVAVVDGEFVDRFSSSAVFFEMVSEAAELFTSGGLSLTVTNTDVVED